MSPALPANGCCLRKEFVCHVFHKTFHLICYHYHFILSRFLTLWHGLSHLIRPGIHFFYYSLFPLPYQCFPADTLFSRKSTILAAAFPEIQFLWASTIACTRSGDSSSRIPSATCLSIVLGDKDILCFSKNFLLAVSQPGMGAVWTMGIPDTAASASYFFPKPFRKFLQVTCSHTAAHEQIYFFL